MSKKILFTLAALAVVCVAPLGASASSITYAQLVPINQDEFVVQSNLQQFYANSQQLLNFGQVLPPALEQQALTAVESDLSNIISAEQDELSTIQAASVPENLVAVQQALIDDWNLILKWEQANGVFSQPAHPPTARAVLGVAYGISLVMFEEENNLYNVNADGFPILPAALYGEIQTLNNAFLSEQGNLTYIVPAVSKAESIE
jgi:hypothetical protein